MLHNNITYKIIDELGKYLPLRKRYLLTKSGNLRLRYIATPIIAVSLISVTILPLWKTNSDITNNYELAYSSQTDKTIEKSTTTNTSKETKITTVATNHDEKNNNKTISLANIKPSSGKNEKHNIPVKEISHIEAVNYIAQNLDKHRDNNGNIRRTNPDIILASSSSINPIKLIKEKNIKIGKGDTVAGALTRSGVSSSDAYQVVKAMEKYLDPRHVKPGQVINLKFDKNGTDFTSMSISLDKISTITINKTEDNNFSSKLHKKEVETKTYAKKAVIKNSLYGSAAKANIPPSVIANIIRIFSWDIDFQRDLRSGDSLEVLYSQQVTEDGEVAKNGHISYAKLTISGHEIPIYRYKNTKGEIDYYDRSGQSIKKTLMKTPIDGGRISSTFGMRKHPVLGYNKMHKGMDFAAPRGTKIYAAGDGVIEKASKYGGYGNYVRIRHNSKLKTAYAHMKKFATGIKSGARVKQGQLIGYVGTTGRSTGPHLHYEVLVNNKQVNPRRVDLPTGEILKGKELNRFISQRKELDMEYAEKSGTLEYVQIDKETPPITR